MWNLRDPTDGDPMVLKIFFESSSSSFVITISLSWDITLDCDMVLGIELMAHTCKPGVLSLSHISGHYGNLTTISMHKTVQRRATSQIDLGTENPEVLLLSLLPVWEEMCGETAVLRWSIGDFRVLLNNMKISGLYDLYNVWDLLIYLFCLLQGSYW